MFYHLPSSALQWSSNRVLDYLTLNVRVPLVCVSELSFPAGMLVPALLPHSSSQVRRALWAELG